MRGGNGGRYHRVQQTPVPSSGRQEAKEGGAEDTNGSTGEKNICEGGQGATDEPAGCVHYARGLQLHVDFVGARSPDSHPDRFTKSFGGPPIGDLGTLCCRVFQQLPYHTAVQPVRKPQWFP